METTQEISVCRTCLKKVDITKCKILTPETLYDGKLILKMLNLCIPEMHINLDCDYPAICRKCLQSLNSLHTFKNMCLKNDLKYCKKYLKEPDLNGSSQSVPSLGNDNTASEGSITVHTTANKDIQSDTVTDVNQNQTPTIKRETELGREKLGKKIFSPYKKRFTNSNCFGCQNHIRDVKYHTRDLCSKNYNCHDCGKTLTSIRDIRKHVHSHLFLYKCEICGKKWRDAHQMSLHLRSHTKQKPFECPECGKRFVQSYNLHQHLATHKGNKDNQNRCEYCGKILSTKYNLKIHLTTHNIGCKPKCSKCDKWFYTEAALLKHLGKCVIIKEENEIFIDEPQFIKSEFPEYVKTEVPEVVKEYQSDDDVFVEETPCQSRLPNLPGVNVKEDTKKFFKNEEHNFL